MGKQDQGSAAAEGTRRATGGAADRRPWGAVLGQAQARDSAASAARGGSRVRIAGAEDHGGAGLAVAQAVSGRGPGRSEEPSDGGLGRRPPSATGQDRRATDGERPVVREGGPAGGRRPFGPAEVDAMRGAHSISTRRAYGVIVAGTRPAASGAESVAGTTRPPDPWGRRRRRRREGCGSRSRRRSSDTARRRCPPLDSFSTCAR